MTAHLPLGSAARLGLGVFLVALANCAPFGPALSLPEQGPTGWSQLTTEHFVLYTDLSPDEGQRWMQRFETIRSVLEDVAFPSSEPPQGAVPVIFFRRDRDYQALAPFGTVGVCVAGASADPDARPTIILVSAELAAETASRDTMPPVIDPCPSRASMSPSCWHSGRSLYVTPEEVEQRFVHEMVHALLHRSVGNPPGWLDEGLAQYLSTLRLEEGRVVLGDPVRAATAVPASVLPSVRELALADPNRFKPRDVDSVTAARYYAGAWSWCICSKTAPNAIASGSGFSRVH